MGKVIIERSYLTAIADALRSKMNNSNYVVPGDAFPRAINIYDASSFIDAFGTGGRYSSSTVTELESSVFEYTNVSEIRLASVTKINENTFAHCHCIESVYILSTGVPYLHSQAFLDTPLDNSEYLGHYASIYVYPSKVEAFKSAAGWSRYSDRIISYTGEPVYSTLSSDYTGYVYIDSSQLTGMCNIIRTKLGISGLISMHEIPGYISQFNEYLMYEMRHAQESMISLPGPSTVRSYVCMNHYALISVYLPDVISIYASAFFNCTKLKNISFPKCEFIEEYTFYSCKALTSIYFPECTYISNNAFNRCSSIVTVDIPKVSYIGNDVFKYCSGITVINCDSLECTSRSAFIGCSALESFHAPKLSYIGTGTFDGCIKLSEIWLYDKRLSYIENSAFINCKALSGLYIAATKLPVLQGPQAFTNTPMANSTYLGYFGSIYVPSSMVDLYKQAFAWSQYSSRITSYAF